LAIPSLIGVLVKTGHLITRARPGSFRVLKYTSLRFDVWFIIQGASWNKDLLGIVDLPWQRSPALGAESTCEALRLGKLIGFYLTGVARPGELGVIHKYIACMAGAGGFSAPRAMTMIETSRFSGNDELERPAQAGSFQGLLSHGLLPLSVSAETKHSKFKAVSRCFPASS